MDNNDILKQLYELKQLCRKVSEHDGSENTLKELQLCISTIPIAVLQNIQPLVISAFYPFLQDKNNSFNEGYRQNVVDTISLMFSKTKLNVKVVFFNIYGFLLNELYDENNIHAVKNVSEEYKLSIIKCVISLTKSLSWDLLLEIYVKENVPKFSIILQMCLCLAKNERLRTLRIASIECIMTIANVDDTSDISDTEMRSQVADMFIYFLPGIAAGLVHVCTEDEKSGHKVALVAVKAWGRIVTLLMQNYNPNNESQDILQELSLENKDKNKNKHRKGIKEINEYLDSFQKDHSWYKEHDKKLELCGNSLKKLTSHQHPKVRFELVEVCGLLTTYCVGTLPKTVSRMIEILITLSEDEYEDISKKAKSILDRLSNNFMTDNLQFKFILEKLEQIFFKTITTLPRIFNGLDEREQLTTLNLLVGFLRLFGDNKLKQILFTPTNLNRLIVSLIHVAELRNGNISLLEEYTIQDLDLIPDLRTPWKVFRFHEDGIQTKLESACHLLAEPSISAIVIDYLMDIFLNDIEHRREATLILNEILSVQTDFIFPKIKEVIYMYLEIEHWQLPIVAENNLATLDVQNNIIQLCLQLEGIGKMALALNKQFNVFLLKVMYLVLEKAGSGQPLLRAAGLLTIVNISVACGYSNVTELINKNSDYFSYHVVRKIKRTEHNESVLNVLAVVMRHSNIEVLDTISDIVDGVLVQSCDKFQEKNVNAFLRVFQIFIKCLHRWLDVKIQTNPMRSREDKEKDIEDFRISNMERLNNDFSDKIMEKTAEEMFKEDMAKNDKLDQDVIEEDEEYKKPEPPMHIKLTVSILTRCLNFLPSKNTTRKLLVLDILKDGLEIIREFEDELLPLVHKIWSPLIDRFKEFNNPLIINLSFQLLLTLAKLSKDFIRSRTVKDVLPFISEVLQIKSRESYLKDKGSAYRYTQNYKMQLSVLQNLYRLMYDIDIGEMNVNLVADALKPYISDKQPKPLQEATLAFFEEIQKYDAAINLNIFKKIEELCKRGNLQEDNEYDKNLNVLRSIICLK